MWKVVLDANYFFSSRLIDEGDENTISIGGDEPSFNNIDHHFVVRLIAKDVPRLIETIAKMRGLATHVAVHSFPYALFLWILFLQSHQGKSGSAVVGHSQG